MSPGAQIVAAVGTLLVAGALAGTVAPTHLAGFARSLDALRLVRAGGAIRIAIGVALLGAARDTGAPALVVAIGALALAAGLVMLWLPRPRAERLARWAGALTPLAVRGWCALGAVVGALLIYAARS